MADFKTASPNNGARCLLIFAAKELSAYPIGTADKNKRRQTKPCNRTRCWSCAVPSKSGFNQNSEAS
jgi:hypothetical protein